MLGAGAGALLAQSAWSADSLAQRIEACAQQQDDTARLKCFDHEVSVMRAGRASAPSAANAAAVGLGGTTTSPPAATRAAPAAAGPAVSGTAAKPTLSVAESRAAEPARPARAAAPGPAAEPPAPVGPVTARVVSISTTPAGRELRIELDNGQVWQQNERETYLSLAAGDSVQIKPASFGSFVLRTPSGVTTRVHQMRR
jgi:hypothetical protein